VHCIRRSLLFSCRYFSLPPWESTMSHDAIENMPSEPPTPTISSLGSELSFEDIPSPVMGAPATGRAKEHSDMFMEGNMITIQVSCLIFTIGLSELMSH
jgi:hypothetical protein